MIYSVPKGTLCLQSVAQSQRTTEAMFHSFAWINLPHNLRN